MDRRTTNSVAIDDFKKDSNIAFGILYQQYFRYTKKFILKNSGNIEDAEDIFQDSLLILYEKLNADHFKAQTCLGNYIIGISKNLWLKKLKNKNFYITSPEDYFLEHQHEISAAIEDEKYYWEKILGYVKSISSHCQNLIHDIFVENKSIEEIQNKYQYSSKHNAQNQKYKCVEQIRKIKDKTFSADFQ
ncbi:sigma-70 family RNA polymerase sigma factor [Chryseobacterium sp. Tr-659]|uniref:RNA polymerase sigma factor n=1 Tax=Chryseobacterium sp. Tr-659 TaxID=2608340 RepID=UPI00142248E6|nr:sigma-70 family RNA polymerase sigma factor [Chryseobacterium sp. Tr-659]NIF03819.1 sigma-70 family RNA polymerase sigma factor [Chryseobacterium sp. Tr-659]